MSIYISGSLAFDRIMNFPGVFSDFILPDKIRMLNVVFLIDSLIEKRGGTAGNIAYNLSLLGEKSIPLSAVGEDFAAYAFYLQDLGISLEGINNIQDQLSAAAYITTDSTSNQITAFHPAAMSFQCEYDFPRLNAEQDIAIISPTNADDMYDHARLYKEKGVRYIFDPGQQIPAVAPEKLAAAIDGSYALASNDYELSLIMKITGLDKNKLLKKTENIITTLGKHGSLISSRDGKESSVNAVAGLEIKDPTGAGDAYRAGLIKGLIQKLDLVEAARIGTITASFCVEKNGTQEHSFTTAEFRARYKNTFGLESVCDFAAYAS